MFLQYIIYSMVFNIEKLIDNYGSPLFFYDAKSNFKKFDDKETYIAFHR